MYVHCTSVVYLSLTAQFQNSAPVLKNRHKIVIKFRKETSWGECDFILYFIKTYILAYVASHAITYTTQQHYTLLSVSCHVSAKFGTY